MTSEPGKHALSFVERVGTAADTDAAVAMFRVFAGHFGYPTVALGELPRPGSSQPGPFFVSTWPESWVETYLGEGLAADDPNVALARNSMSPASWSEMREGPLGTLQANRVLDATASHGWRQGLGIPVHGPGGYHGLVVVAGEGRALPHHDRAALHLMGLHLHNRLLAFHAPERLAPPQALARLSAGEIESIRWLLAGKGDWEIGEILCIAEATAHWRIEQAKKKLGVKTRAQLTALAVHYGLVQP